MARSKKQSLSVEQWMDQAVVSDNDHPYELPMNWIWTKLGSVCKEVQYGYTAKSSTEEIGPKLLRITDIQDGGVDWSNVPFCEISQVEYSKFKLDPNDIVVARTGATTGKSYLISEHVDSVFASYLIRVKLNNLLNYNYLYHFMQSNLYWGQITELAQGIAQPGVNASKLQTMSYPLPPLAEQERIVDRIESLFTKLDQAEELAQTALDSFETRKAAILHKAFTGELTAKWREEHGLSMDSWSTSLLKETDIQIIDGDRGENYPKKEEFTIEGYCLFLNAKNVTKNGFVFEELQFISKERDSILRKGRLEKGDIVLTTRGTIGNIAYFDESVPYEHLRINSGMVIFRGGVDFFKPFLCWLFRTGYITNQISDISTGSAQPQLPIKIMKDLRLPIPNITEQEEIVRILEVLLERETRTKELVDVIDGIELMKKAILARAFRGELGTNDPSEDKAFELLREVVVTQ